jgi:hypothetical protein
MKTEETVFEKNLVKEDFKSSFIKDLGDCDMKMVFSKKVITYSYSGDLPPGIYHEPAILMEIIIKNDTFLNKTNYLDVHFIDFKNRLVSGYVHEDHIDSVLTDECYRKLYGKDKYT